MPAYPQKITFGDMRASGVRDVLIYCRDYRRGHHIEINADCWTGAVRLSDIHSSAAAIGAPSTLTAEDIEPNDAA